MTGILTAWYATPTTSVYEITEPNEKVPEAGVPEPSRVAGIQGAQRTEYLQSAKGTQELNNPSTVV